MKTHCSHGHEYTEANTYRLGRKRYCRACGAKRSLERYHAKGIKDKRNKTRDREVWRGYYRRYREKNLARNAADVVAMTDNYVLTLIADNDKRLRSAARSTPKLISAYRAQLQLKRLIHERSK